MPDDRDLVALLVRTGNVLTPWVAPPDASDQLHALCATARQVFGAAAVSVARLDGDELVFEASEGVGADEITGVRLGPGQGLAGFVAATGQALMVDSTNNDGRFARDVAEETGYVPTAMLVVPVVDPRGGVLGVLSILDRDSASANAGADALSIASAFAAQVALLLPLVGSVVRLGPHLLAALVAAVAADDVELAAALHQRGEMVEGADDGLLAVSAALAKLGAGAPEIRAAALRVLEEMVAIGSRADRR